jgi:hypothetical protein
MKSNKSHLALMGVLALGFSITVGLVSGSVADAKKKKGKLGGSVTIAKTTPTALPPGSPEEPTGCGLPPTFTTCTVAPKTSLTTVPLTVGKKAKNQVVSLGSVSLTYTITGSARTGAGTATDVPAAASNVRICLTAPNGRTACASQAGFFDPNATTIGPVTETPDSPISVCPTTPTGTNGTQTVCGGGSFLIAGPQDPEATVGPPTYAGTIGNNTLAFLGGVPAKGTWTFKLRNTSSRTPATVSSVSATIGLTPAASSSGGGKKKK